mmetsp:Transcript_21404/g.24499  ORF Transcript_21404/g.24499 Transcript_21404/m.24499 type:complete len:711 (-) Transcript_21404:209-2341(-)
MNDASFVASTMPSLHSHPVVAFTTKEESAIQDALLTSCKVLEEARCLKSEREANLMMASSMLANNGKADVDVSNMPGGIQDAWIILSEVTSTDSTIKTPVINLPQQQQQDNNNSQKSATLPIGQGQLGKVATVTALSACVHRTSVISNHIAQDCQQRDGAILKSALETTKMKLSTTSMNTAQAVSATTNLWLRILDHRLKDIRSYHARHSNNEATSKMKMSSDNTRKNQNKRARLGNPGADGYDLASSMVESLEGIQEGTIFSSEEVMGKYLDMQPLYESYVIPIKSFMKTKSSFGFVDFLIFLSKGENGLVEGITESSKLKERKKYVRFLVALENYLDGFLKRVQPLSSKNQITMAVVQDFEDIWSQSGGSPGWESKPTEAFLVNNALSAENISFSDSDNITNNGSLPAIDLSIYGSASDLEQALDGDMLKAKLTRLGLKCGGTVSDRAKRLFMTKDTPLDKLPKKLFAKKKTTIDTNTGTIKETPKNGAATTAVHVNVKNERRVDIAKREVVVMALLNQLKPILEATVRRTGRRETQTTKEREKEMDEDLHGTVIEGSEKKRSAEGKEGKYDSDDNSDDEDAPVYNPKGVPLGWDGKPIPYWLFKLHGLNHYYTCEICGGESYRGRKNFETHFAEAKHSYGMKILGIPNTKHFHGVTKIEDAQNLWKKLKDKLEQDQFDGTNGEEYEDSHGNVLSRATYEDLARQGLL